MELKHGRCNILSFIAGTINRTIMELKPYVGAVAQVNLKAINRTIMELKQSSITGSLQKGFTINRTIMELKPHGFRCSAMFCRLSIAPSWN